VKHALKVLDPLTEQPAGTADATGGFRNRRSPYLTAREAVEYLGLGSLSALYRHVRENDLPVCRLGRLYRFDVRALDAHLRGTTELELWRERRASVR
jgi:excisionase family DNA binding protein